MPSWSVLEERWVAVCSNAEDKAIGMVWILPALYSLLTSKRSLKECARVFGYTAPLLWMHGNGAGRRTRGKGDKPHAPSHRRLRLWTPQRRDTILHQRYQPKHPPPSRRGSDVNWELSFFAKSHVVNVAILAGRSANPLCCVLLQSSVFDLKTLVRCRNCVSQVGQLKMT